MNKAESIRLADSTKGLFPFLTDEQALVLAETYQRADYWPTVRAIKQHAVRHEYFSLPQLVNGLNAAMAAERARTAKHQRTVDWIRAEATRVGWDTSAESDEDVVFGHYAACWGHAERGTAHPAGKVAARRMIRGHARAAAAELGMDDAAASDLADKAVGLARGETIAWPSIFRPVSDAGRGRDAQAAKVGINRADA